MKAKKILLSILAVVIIAVAFIFVYGSLQPAEVTLERSVVVDQQIETVYNYVSDFRNWNEWSVWNLRDTTMKVSYSGNIGGAGAVMSWTSENSGNGKQTITGAELNSFLKTELDFGSMGSALSDWKFEETADGTKITWSFWSETGGPFARGLMALFFDMEAQIGKDYDEGLQNLKTKLESLPKNPKITEEDVEGFYYLGVMNTLENFDMASMMTAYSQSYQKIGEYMQQANMQPQGAPICIIHEYSTEKITFEPAMVVSALPANVNSPLSHGEVKPCKAIKGIHMGDYAGMEKTYEAIEKYIAGKGYQVAGKVWEAYLTDPETEKDTAKWETHIYFPVTM